MCHKRPLLIIDRSNPRKLWPGGSVWSVVCAVELGLIEDGARSRPFFSSNDENFEESDNKISSGWTHFDSSARENNESTKGSIESQEEQPEASQREAKVLAQCETIGESEKGKNEEEWTGGSRLEDAGELREIPTGGPRASRGFREKIKTAHPRKKTRSRSRKIAGQSVGKKETVEPIAATRNRAKEGNGGKQAPRAAGVAGAETRSVGGLPSSIRMETEDREDREQTIDQRRPLTRGQAKNAFTIWKPCFGLSSVPGKTSGVGRLIWGYCMGWWPALIVEAEHVGMSATPNKLWVYWIGESRISELRTKSQVQPFSQNLESRLMDHLRDKAATKARIVASVATLKLLAERLEILLTKPYCNWAERELASLSTNELNEMYFYPYPCDVRESLENLRKENIRASEKKEKEKEKQKQRQQVVSATSPKEKENQPQEGSSGSTGKISATIQCPEEHLALLDQKPGVIAWAKISGHAWWPAMIVDHRDAGMDEPNFGCQWIIWYGDYKLSQVHHRDFLKFEMGFEKVREYTVQAKRISYVAGVLDASKDYCSRLGYKTDHWKLTDALGWFSRVTLHSKSARSCEAAADAVDAVDAVDAADAADALPGVTGLNDNQLKYTERILKKLREIKGDRKVAALRERAIESTGLAGERVDAARLLERSCLVCLGILRESHWQEHPFFEGSVCDECMELYKPSMFAYGDDGKCFFCTLCAGTDTVVMCDAHDCPRVYCTACLKYLISPRSYRAILLQDPWFCFLCKNDARLASDGLVKPRCNWKERMLRLFCRKDDTRNWDHPPSLGTARRKMRVLSLFDGLSTGLLVLRKLGIEIECYYASEIDPDAEAVSVAHFGDRVVRLGDVRHITRKKINDIGPIDLLIGGSPCNDLSLANPHRLGLHDPKGTGILFFEYCRILKLLKETNGDRHYFWLYENVASMPSKYRLEINAHLGQEPDFVDSADFSAQHRPRLYWSNLPIVSQHSLDTQDLQDVLTPNCNRQALVKKIQTVTTRVNSLRQGKALCKPVLMNNKEDSIWITELEEIFGFPRHFTDVKNLSVTKRQKLIGKSWSVQTLTAIMRPLRYFFEITEIEP